MALLLHLSPPLSGTFSSHLTLASAPRRAFLHPPLLVTFTLHLLPYYSTLMCHFPRASPRSISTHFNMVSFSLFLSHLYMTLFLFITHRQYYSPQLFRGGFSHHFFAFNWIFLTSFPGFSSDNHVLTRFLRIFLYPRLIRGGGALAGFLFYILDQLSISLRGLSAEGFKPPDFLYFPPFFYPQHVRGRDFY